MKFNLKKDNCKKINYITIFLLFLFSNFQCSLEIAVDENENIEAFESGKEVEQELSDPRRPWFRLVLNPGPGDYPSKLTSKMVFYFTSTGELTHS